MMQLEEQFSRTELEQLIDQALLHQCACPAQVARMMLEMRATYRYQYDCLALETGELAETHRLIAQTVQAAHALLQDTLDQVLELEGWDRTTLSMPAGLRKRQFAASKPERD